MMCRKGGAQCQVHKRHLIDGGDAVTGSTRPLRVWSRAVPWCGTEDIAYSSLQPGSLCLFF